MFPPPSSHLSFSIGDGEEQLSWNDLASRLNALAELLKGRRGVRLGRESYIENYLVILDLAYSAWETEKDRTLSEKRAA